MLSPYSTKDPSPTLLMLLSPPPSPPPAVPNNLFSTFITGYRNSLNVSVEDVRDRKITYTGFCESQYIITQAILGRKLMKKFTVTDEKIFRVCKAFDHENNSHADLRTSHAQFSGKDCQYREEDS